MMKFGGEFSVEISIVDVVAVIVIVVVIVICVITFTYLVANNGRIELTYFKPITWQ